MKARVLLRPLLEIVLPKIDTGWGEGTPVDFFTSSAQMTPRSVGSNSSLSPAQPLPSLLYFPHSTSTLGNFVKCLLSYFHMLPPQLQCGIRRVKKKKQVLLIAVPPCKLGFHVPSTWGVRDTSAERVSGAGGGQASKPGRHRPSARAPSSTRHAASLLKKRSIKLIRLLCHSTNLLPHSLLCFKRSCTRAIRF